MTGRVIKDHSSTATGGVLNIFFVELLQNTEKQIETLFKSQVLGKCLKSEF